MSRPLSLPSMDVHPIIDSLTSHISLYHLSSSSSSSTNPNPNPRSSVLKWFSSLNVHQRRAHLTAVDPAFVRLLLRMEAKIRAHGPGLFIVLPDLPSRGAGGRCENLPTLCFRKSHGLLARVSDRNAPQLSLRRSVQLFGSREGEDMSKERCWGSEGLDSMTLCEDFVSNVDEFVTAMDAVSNGGFLMGEESGLGADWVEMKWLKAKGYYSLEEFAANRFEVALRLAWLSSSSNCKKRAPKLKEKATVSGVAVNVFWRKKGSMDWWGSLDGSMQRKVFKVFLGTGAKSLADEILIGVNNAIEDEMCILSVGAEEAFRHSSAIASRRTTAGFAEISTNAKVGATAIIGAPVPGKSTPFPSVFNALMVLQDILSIMSSCQQSDFSKEKLFFSTLASVGAISDCVLRKLRGCLMVVSLDCTKLELFGEGDIKPPHNKSKESSGQGKQKKKVKARNKKKLDTIPILNGDDQRRIEPLEDHGCGPPQTENVVSLELSNMGCIPLGVNTHKEASPSTDHAYVLADENVQSAARKSRRGRTKSKRCNSACPLGERNVETRTSQVSSSSNFSRGEAGNSNGVSDFSIVENGPYDDSVKSKPSSCSQSSTHETARGNDTALNLQGDTVVCSAQKTFHSGSERDQLMSCALRERITFSKSNGNSHVVMECKQNTKGASEKENMSFRSNTETCTGDCRAASNLLSSAIKQPIISSRSSSASHVGMECEQNTNSASKNENLSFGSNTETCTGDCRLVPNLKPVVKHDNFLCNKDISFCVSGKLNEMATKSTSSIDPMKAISTEDKTVVHQGQEAGDFCDTGQASSVACPSYEWPGVGYMAPVNSQHLPAATDRLHLDVGHNWHNHFRQEAQAFVPAMHQARNPTIESSRGRGRGRIVSRQLPMSLDWPPMVRSISGLTPSMAYTCDSSFVSRRWQGFTAHGLHLNTTATEGERKYSGDCVDMADLTSTHDLADEFDSHWAEEECELHAVPGMDYNQYFGGGVMYWSPSDHPGSGFSRPPSLSSDDSSWAWHEADMNRAVDDMVAFSSSYSTNGLASPTAASFCSSFDTLGPGHQALGYVMPTNEVTGKALHSSTTMLDEVAEEKSSGTLASLPVDVDGKTGDSLPYPILRPIIIPNPSRERSRSEFKSSRDHKSPCVRPATQEQPRIKRPPSPVVLCVPRAPLPPPPSPVSNSRKHRGFPTVRSGSSSPRNWGIRGWYQDGTNFEEACICMDGTEVVWPWRNKNLSARPMIQPLPGTLLQDHLMAISQLACDQEHPDVVFPLQPPESANCSMRKASISLIHSLLHEEINSFCKRVAAENMIKKPYINWAVKRVTRSLQVLWPRSRTNIFGSTASGLSLPTSDVDLVVCLPPVRNLEPIKEAGILEGRNGIKETCLQHAARYLANQEWVKIDSLKTVENTAIPIIMLVVEVPSDLITPGAPNDQTPKDDPNPKTKEQNNHVQIDMVGLENSISSKCSLMNCPSGNDSKSVRLDISFKSSSHTGLHTTELVKELTEQFPAAIPLALVLKKFLADRSLDQSYSGGLSSYCLVLLIIRFLQHEHHLGRPINQSYGSLLMDFLYFFGAVECILSGKEDIALIQSTLTILFFQQIMWGGIASEYTNASRLLQMRSLFWRMTSHVFPVMLTQVPGHCTGCFIKLFLVLIVYRLQRPKLQAKDSKVITGYSSQKLIV